MLKLSAGFLLISSLDTLCSAVMDEVDESFVKVWQPCFYSSMTVVKLLTDSLTALATEGVSRVTLGSGDWG